MEFAIDLLSWWTDIIQTDLYTTFLLKFASHSLVGTPLTENLEEVLTRQVRKVFKILRSFGRKGTLGVNWKIGTSYFSTIRGHGSNLMDWRESSNLDWGYAKTGIENFSGNVSVIQGMNLVKQGTSLLFWHFNAVNGRYEQGQDLLGNQLQNWCCFDKAE